MPAPTGVELIENGDFSSGSTDWTVGSGWSIDQANNKADAVDAAFGSQLIHSDNLVPNTTYKVSFEVSNYVKGNISVDVGNVFSSTVSQDGSYSFTLIAANTQPFRLTTYAGGSGTTLSVSNISVQQILDGDFDFTRSTYATRVNSQGLIEKERSNLLLQSNNFDTTWTVSGAPPPTGGQTGYDGSSDAWLLTKTGPAGRIIQSISVSGVNTISAYVKANASDWAVLEINGVGFSYFDLQNGVVGSGNSVVATSIESVGNGWYRCSYTGNGTGINGVIYVGDSNGVISGTSGSIYIQDAQLEQGLVATDYIETNTIAVYEGITDNVPRLDYDGDCPSLLLEPQRTEFD